MKISDLIPLEKNPYKLRGDAELEKLKNSIQSFEKMMSIRKIIIDETNTILGGNKRYFALKSLGYKEIPENWIDKITNLSEDEKKEFIVKDNVGFGEWDFDILNDWDVDFEEWGIEQTAKEIETIELENEKIKDDFEQQINDIKDKDAKYPIIPEFNEDYNAFIIISKNEIDELYIRNLFGITEPIFTNEHGLSNRNTNIIDVEHLKKVLRCNQ